MRSIADLEKPRISKKNIFLEDVKGCWLICQTNHNKIVIPMLLDEGIQFQPADHSVDDYGVSQIAFFKHRCLYFDFLKRWKCTGGYWQIDDMEKACKNMYIL